MPVVLPVLVARQFRKPLDIFCELSSHNVRTKEADEVQHCLILREFVSRCLFLLDVRSAFV